MEGRLGLAQSLVKELSLPSNKYAFVGGSVGRGDDDEWSDIDLTVCVEEAWNFVDSNMIFEGEIVQLHISSPLSWDAVERNPQEYRFLLETVPVYDPEFTFYAFKDKASAYIRSPLGKQRKYHGWIQVIDQRKAWMKESIHSGNMYSASAAAGAAWADAAFMRSYFAQGLLSTGKLIPFMENHWPCLEREDVTIAECYDLIARG